MSGKEGAGVQAELGRMLRRHDHDRFLTTLFAPADARPALLALYAFNFEVAKTREVVSEPMLGRIRLQWWRDSLDEIYAGAAPRRHEVIEPLAAAIRERALTRSHFAMLIDARERDLDDAPPESLEALEGYAEASSAPLVLLALEALGQSGAAAEAAGRAVGTGYALTGLLRAVPVHARAKRLYLPRALAEAAGLDIDRGLFELRPSPALSRVVERVAARATSHLDKARALAPQVPRAALPALLPAVLARADLARLKRA
ncbi:MAG TPA: phytoene/squalene synthase family protein, partial [Stellaceae bacterium]|nr:phytoene/squalene synthase family protein [Stellaceae bacterium]